MQSEFSPAITRLDVVLWFLRAFLWYSAISAILWLGQSFNMGIPLWTPHLLVGSGVPILVLLLFPHLLATGALGTGAREIIGSVSELRSLVGRCAGLALLVGCLGWTVLYSVYILYSLTRGTPLSSAFSAGIIASVHISQIVVSAMQFFLGFALAFGPAIRDNFRAR